MPNYKVLKDIIGLIESALKAEFDRGRLDGVKAGYKDGYADALSAIVAAVKADSLEDLDTAPAKKPAVKKAPAKKPVTTPEPTQSKYENLSVFDLGLTTRTAKALSRNGIGKVGELIVFTAAELRSIPRFGKGALNETTTQLKKLGLELKS